MNRDNAYMAAAMTLCAPQHRGNPVCAGCGHAGRKVVDAAAPHLTADLVRERDEALAEVERARRKADYEAGGWDAHDKVLARAEKAEAAIGRVEALCDDAATCWPNTDGRPVASVIRIALVRAALRGDA